MKKLLLLLFFLIALSSYGYADTAISDCSVALNSANTRYYLTSSFSTGTIASCLNVSAANVILDGTGYSINGTGATTLISLKSGTSNFTGYNITATDILTTGISISSRTGQFYNSNFSSSATTLGGIVTITSAAGQILDGGSITSTATGTSYLVYIGGGTGMYVQNMILSSTKRGFDIEGAGSGSYPIINNVTSNTAGSFLYSGLSTWNNTYVNNSAISITAGSIAQSARNTAANIGTVTIRNSVLNATGLTIFTTALANAALILINTTATYTNEVSIATTSNGSWYSRRWYVDANAKNSTGSNLANVNITIKDVNSNTVYNGLTDGSGNIPQQTLEAYNITVGSNTSGTYTYLSNYTIQGVLDGYATQTVSFNLTDNTQTNLNMTESTGSCTYTSGNWIIQASDGCNISVSTNLFGNNITFNGTGTTRINTTITNFSTCTAQNGANIIVNSGGILG